VQPVIDAGLADSVDTDTALTRDVHLQMTPGRTPGHLRHPDTKRYPGIAATLATMAELYERGGRSADFASFIAQIRQDYGRRPSLMKAQDAKGL
jgi:hypothetical protein